MKLFKDYTGEELSTRIKHYLDQFDNPLASRLKDLLEKNQEPAREIAIQAELLSDKRLHNDGLDFSDSIRSIRMNHIKDLNQQITLREEEHLKRIQEFNDNPLTINPKEMMAYEMNYETAMEILRKELKESIDQMKEKQVKPSTPKFQ